MVQQVHHGDKKTYTFYLGKKKFVLMLMRDDATIKKGDEFAVLLLGLNDFVSTSIQSGIIYVLVGKEEVKPQIVPGVVKGLLDEFQDVMPVELPNGL